MNRRFCFLLRYLAIALLVLSIILPTIATANTNIIGGAGWPTFWFYFQKTALLAWLGTFGLCLSIFLRRKR